MVGKLEPRQDNGNLTPAIQIVVVLLSADLPFLITVVPDKTEPSGGLGRNGIEILNAFVYE